jgi:tetratricopeptide (TPR) repeat protein
MGSNTKNERGTGSRLTARFILTVLCELLRCLKTNNPLSAAQFDQKVAVLQSKIEQLPAHEIKVLFAQLIANFGYGHTAIYLHPWQRDPALDFTMVPIQFYWFEDGVYIQASEKKYQHLLGAKVVKINNTPILQALNQIRPTISAENDSFFKTTAMVYMTSPQVLAAKGIIDNVTGIPLVLEKDGKVFKQTIAAKKMGRYPGKYGFIPTKGDWVNVRKNDEHPLWLKNFDLKYDSTYLKEQKTVYVRYSEVINDDNNLPVSEFFNTVLDFVNTNDVNKLVLDLRLNGGGENGNNHEVVLGLIKNAKINQVGKLYVITGRRTFSAAQNLVNHIETYTNAVFVGEPTAENVNFMGDANFETLPKNKLRVRLSHTWWQDKDPRDKRQATLPDIAVQMTFDQYVNNIDPALTAIFDAAQLLIDANETIKSQNLTQIKRFYQQYKNHQYFGSLTSETKLNRLGYAFLNANKQSASLDAFKLNTDIYPQSANAWNSYAERLLKSGNKPLAKAYYQKSIDLDPNGRIGEHSKSMMDNIR